ncbi:unnamed protein product [Rhizophagus irregularis]|uniref:Uncharacterized protein n=1 Tax=Rhizophagus irregularis TaxID=588596 RepID=A0A915ZEE5_9GLOM|nr:unnamed protein product [Rhizophagus irregularis]CAB5365112.1 unnamed protein product [Rhizophagus irregularis]CAB5373210.1 unnamed protein product [Rhizophagus irregularis]
MFFFSLSQKSESGSKQNNHWKNKSRMVVSTARDHLITKELKAEILITEYNYLKTTSYRAHSLLVIRKSYLILIVGKYYSSDLKFSDAFTL